MEKLAVARAPSVIAILAVFYATGLWRVAATIGPNTVFAPDRITQRAEFASFVRALDQMIVRECQSKGRQTILFNDADVALPYLTQPINMGLNSDHCSLIRPTIVSPLKSLPQSSACSAVLVEEWSLYRTRRTLTSGQSEPSLVGQGIDHELIDSSTWQRRQSWHSSAGTFNFATYRPIQCPAAPQ